MNFLGNYEVLFFFFLGGLIRVRGIYLSAKLKNEDHVSCLSSPAPSYFFVFFNILFIMSFMHTHSYFVVFLPYFFIFLVYSFIFLLIFFIFLHVSLHFSISAYLWGWSSSEFFQVPQPGCYQQGGGGGKMRFQEFLIVFHFSSYQIACAQFLEWRREGKARGCWNWAWGRLELEVFPKCLIDGIAEKEEMLQQINWKLLGVNPLNYVRILKALEAG